MNNFGNILRWFWRADRPCGHTSRSRTDDFSSGESRLTLEIFRCDRRSLTLSKAGCSKLYDSANGPKAPEPWEGRAACRACPVGALNLTGILLNPVAMLKERMRYLCPRCCRLSSRLIWGQLCASCDVRQREAVAGRNAKGNRPALSGQIHTERLAVTGGGITKTLIRHGVASLQEVMLHAAKSSGVPITYGRRRVQWTSLTQLDHRGPWTSQLEILLS